jgi:RNA polymerase sigma-70 factor, ECF subfamily
VGYHLLNLPLIIKEDNGIRAEFNTLEVNKTEQIWLNLSANLKSFILSKISDKAAAEDILQEVFIRMHLRIDTLKDHTKLKPWLYQITRNLIADYYRDHKKENHLIYIESETDDNNADLKLMEKAIQDMIKMMDDLPAEYCEALCLTELEGLSQVVYAERIGIPYSSAKSRVQRSRKLLKEMLMKCCHYHFDKYGTVLSIAPNNCCCCNPTKSS